MIFNLTQRGVSRRGALFFRRCRDLLHEKLTGIQKLMKQVTGAPDQGIAGGIAEAAVLRR